MNAFTRVDMTGRLLNPDSRRWAALPHGSHPMDPGPRVSRPVLRFIYRETLLRAVQPASLTGYDVIDVKGSSYERGFAYGEHHSDRLKRLLQSHYRYYSTYLNVSREEVLDEAIKYEGPVRDYSEEVAEELRGTAEGAG